MTWYDEFDEMFHKLNRPFIDIENILKQVSNSASQLVGPYFYGYSMTIGPDGKPVVREFGNIKPNLTDASGVKHPNVDQILDKKEKQLKLIAELPGVEKKDIKVNVVNNVAHIEASYKDSKYNADVNLQNKVEENSAKASYNNGILEVTFRLKDNEKPKGKVVIID